MHNGPISQWVKPDIGSNELNAIPWIRTLILQLISTMVFLGRMKSGLMKANTQYMYKSNKDFFEDTS